MVGNNLWQQHQAAADLHMHSQQRTIAHLCSAMTFTLNSTEKTNSADRQQWSTCRTHKSLYFLLVIILLLCYLILSREQQNKAVCVLT